MTRLPDHARTLLNKAHDDAMVVQHACTDPAIADWIVGFHAQQAIEKAVKAVLTQGGHSYPPTHDLEHLLELCAQAGIEPPHSDRLPGLTPYGAVLRYEGTVAAGPAFDRHWAHACVQDVLAWAGTLVA
jgi:hypothetical protein